MNNILSVTEYLYKLVVRGWSPLVFCLTLSICFLRQKMAPPLFCSPNRQLKFFASRSKFNCVGFILILFLITVMLSGCFAYYEKPFDKQIKARDLIDQGVSQLEQGFAEQAMATFEMAFEVYPLAEALDGIGCVHLYNGDLTTADRYFNMALDTNPDYAEAVAHLAMTAELRGKVKLANQLYQQALLMEPEDVRTRNNYSAFLYDRYQAGDSGLTQARKELLRANSLTNSDIIKDNYNIIEGEYEK